MWRFHCGLFALKSCDGELQGGKKQTKESNVDGTLISTSVDLGKGNKLRKTRASGGSESISVSIKQQ